MVHIIYSWHAFKLIFQLHILTYSYFKIEWENDKHMYNETHILCELKIWSEFFISINIMTNQNWYKHLKVQLSVQVSVQVSVNYYFQWRNGQILICRVSNKNQSIQCRDAVWNCLSQLYTIAVWQHIELMSWSSPNCLVNHTPSHNGILTVQNLPYLEEVLTYCPLQLYSACLVLFLKQYKKIG